MWSSLVASVSQAPGRAANSGSSDLHATCNRCLPGANSELYVCVPCVLRSMPTPPSTASVQLALLPVLAMSDTKDNFQVCCPVTPGRKTCPSHIGAEDSAPP